MRLHGPLSGVGKHFLFEPNTPFPSRIVEDEYERPTGSTPPSRDPELYVQIGTSAVIRLGSWGERRGGGGKIQCQVEDVLDVCFSSFPIVPDTAYFVSTLIASWASESDLCC